MQTIIVKYGYLGIFLLIAIENVFPPIPSEVILTFSGFVCRYSDLSILSVIIFSTLGSIFGAIILYFLGFFLNKKKIITIARSKVGHLLKLKEDKILNSIDVFNEEGGKSIFICRFIPILRSLISIPAGISRYNFSIFLLLTSIGSLLWNTIFILLGNMLGENWELVISIFKNYYKPIIIGIVLLFFFIKRIKKHHKTELHPLE